MADDYANVTIARKMHGDRRFDLLAELGGWTRNDACWRMTELFSRCTALQTDRPPPEVIRAHLGLRGEQLLLDSTLGERCPDGSIRVRGGGLTGGDTDRFGWYEPVREQQREAGSKRAKSAIRGQGGRFGRAPDGTGAGPALSSGSASAGPAEPADHQRSPAPHQPQRSEIRISEEDLSLSRDPAVPTLHRHPTTPPPEPVSVPVVSQPSPVHEDIAGTQAAAESAPPAATDLGFCNQPRILQPSGPGVADPSPSREVAKPSTPVGDRDVKPANAILIPPGESAWHRRMRWWGAMLEADQRLRAAGIEPNAPSLPKSPAGENEKNMARCERQLVDSGFSPDEVDAKMLHIVAIAEAEAMRPDNRSRKFFKPALIWDPERANRQFDTSLDEAKRPRSAPSQRAGPQPVPPRPRDRDPPPKVIPRDQLAGPEQLAESWKALGIAGEPTTEMHKRLNSNDDDTPDPDEKTRRRRKAKTA